jgi:hypothetical protein
MRSSSAATRSAMSSNWDALFATSTAAKLSLDKAVRAFTAARNARGLRLGLETSLSDRRIIALCAPSDTVHDSRSARPTRRTSLVPEVQADESPKPPGVSSGTTSTRNIKRCCFLSTIPLASRAPALPGLALSGRRPPHTSVVADISTWNASAPPRWALRAPAFPSVAEGGVS